MDNGTLFNMNSADDKRASEQRAILLRARAALQSLGELRPIVTVTPKRNGEGGYSIYFRAPLGQMLGVGLQTRLSDDPETAALQAIELLPKCIPSDPDLITGRARRRQRSAPPPAPPAPPPPAEPAKPADAGARGERMAVYYETLSAMLEDVGEQAIAAMVQLIKAARSGRPG